MSKKRSYSIYKEQNVQDYLLLQTSQQEQKIQTIVEILRTDYPYLFTIDDKNEIPFVQYTNPDRAKSFEFYQNNIILQSNAKRQKDIIDSTQWIWISETKPIETSSILISNLPNIEEKLMNSELTYTFKFSGNFLNQLSLVSTPGKFYYNTKGSERPGKHFTEDSWLPGTLVELKDTQMDGRQFQAGRTVMHKNHFYKLFYKLVVQIGTKLLTDNKIEYFRNLTIDPSNVKIYEEEIKGSHGIKGLSKRGTNETLSKTLNYITIKNVKVKCYKSISGSDPSFQFNEPLTYVDKFLNTIHEFIIPEISIPFQIAGSKLLPFDEVEIPQFTGTVWGVNSEVALLDVLINQPEPLTIQILESFTIVNPITISKQCKIFGKTRETKISQNGTEITSFTVTSDNVVFENITLENFGTGSTATVITFNNVNANSCFVKNCTIRTNEFGIVVNTNSVQITDCKFEFVNTPDSHRFIYLQRCTGTARILNNTFQGNSPTNSGTTVIEIGNTTGSNFVGGQLQFCNNNNIGLNPVRRVFFNDGIDFNGTNFSIQMINNNFQIFNGYCIFYNAFALQGIKYIVLINNIETLSTDSSGSKGIIGLDQPGTNGQLFNIPIYGGGNKTGSLRFDYSSISKNEHTGNVTSASNDSIFDALAGWDNDQWVDSVFGTGIIEILSGTGAGQTRTVGKNTQNTIYITSPWAENPDNTSVYKVILSNSAIAYYTSKYNQPAFYYNLKRPINDFILKPYYWNPNFVIPDLEMTNINPATAQAIYPREMKFMRNPPKIGYKIDGQPAQPLDPASEIVFKDTHVLGITPKIYYDNEANDIVKPLIILVQNVSHSLDNYLVTPLTIGDKLEINKDLVRLFISQNHLPLGIVSQLEKTLFSQVGSVQTWQWHMPFFEIEDFTFDNSFQHDIRDRAIEGQKYVDYIPSNTVSEFFVPNLEISTKIDITASYDYFRPKAGYVSRTHTTLRDIDIEKRFLAVETEIEKIKSDVKTTQSQITQLALFSAKLYDAVVENYKVLFNVVKNENNSIERENIDKIGSGTRSAKGIFIKLFNLIPVVGQYSNIVDQALDVAITAATEIGKNQIVDEILTIKDAAIAMSIVDTQLIANILAKNYVVDEEDKKKLGRNSLSHLEEIQFKLRLIQNFEELYPKFVQNKCTYYLRKINQFKAAGDIAWKYARLNYTDTDMQKSNLIPGHAFLEIVLTKVKKQNQNYTLRQHIFIVSTGDFNGLGYNIALLTLLRETQRKSLFNYVHLTKDFDFNQKKYIWSDYDTQSKTSQMEEKYYAFWKGLSQERIDNPTEDQHVAVLQTECNIQPDACQIFLDSYKFNAPAYNILGFNCQVQAKEVMNFLVQGLVPSWWTNQQNIDLAVQLVEQRPEFYDNSFKQIIENPQEKPVDP